MIPMNVRAKDPMNSATRAAPRRTGIRLSFPPPARYLCTEANVTRVEHQTYRRPPTPPAQAASLLPPAKSFPHFFPKILGQTRTPATTYRISDVTCLLPWVAWHAERSTPPFLCAQSEANSPTPAAGAGEAGGMGLGWLARCAGGARGATPRGSAGGGGVNAFGLTGRRRSAGGAAAAAGDRRIVAVVRDRHAHDCSRRRGPEIAHLVNRAAIAGCGDLLRLPMDRDLIDPLVFRVQQIDVHVLIGRPEIGGAAADFTSEGDHAFLPRHLRRKKLISFGIRSLHLHAVPRHEGGV